MKRIAVIDSKYIGLSTIESVKKIFMDKAEIQYLLPVEAGWETRRADKLYQRFDIFFVSAQAFFVNFSPEKLLTELGNKNAKVVALSFDKDYLTRLTGRIDFCYERSDFEDGSDMFPQIKEQMLLLL